LVGWAAAQNHDFLPGQLSLQEAAAGDATLVATLIVLAVALAVILPSLALLFRLFQKGQLEQEFHPIGSQEGGSS
jgi:cytochrome d ubiquinol oxidase subunit II